jgi:hypothetical protein
MAVEPDEELEDDETLADGDTVPERLEKVDVSEDDTCSTDEMRDRLDL